MATKKQVNFDKMFKIDSNPDNSSKVLSSTIKDVKNIFKNYSQPDTVKEKPNGPTLVPQTIGETTKIEQKTPEPKKFDMMALLQSEINKRFT